MKITSLRGMSDVLPPQINTWVALENKLREVSERFGFDEIRTPLLEDTALFKRGVGEDTDIVEKEMYTFVDKGGESVSLRPEGTASVVRSLVENSWFRANPVSKFHYIGPMFRYERPQKGRFRQFHQFGIELLGVPEPTADVEVISFMNVLIKEFGLKSVELHLSSIGCDACRPPYKKKLIAELEKIKDKLPVDFHKRIPTNPQRVFDLKDENAQKHTQNLPVLMDHLCADCSAHFAGVKEGLDNLGITYKVNPKIVRGLDYYNRTAFEFISSDLGAQSTVCGGGRYDKLVEQFGGPAVPAVGFGMGLERFVLILEAIGYQATKRNEISVISADDEGRSKAQKLTYDLREKGYLVDTDLQGKNIKNQFKRADKLQSKIALILGAQEIQDQSIVIKNLNTQDQKKLLFKDLSTELEKLFPNRAAKQSRAAILKKLLEEND